VRRGATQRLVLGDVSEILTRRVSGRRFGNNKHQLERASAKWIQLIAEGIANKKTDRAQRQRQGPLRPIAAPRCDKLDVPQRPNASASHCRERRVPAMIAKVHSKGFHTWPVVRRKTGAAMVCRSKLGRC